MQTQLTGHHLQQLQSALLDGFDHATLSRLVRYELELDLEWITPVQGKRDLTTIVADLVTYCASQEGGFKRLLVAACEQNPNNPQLSTIAIEWAALEFAPIALPESHPAIQATKRGVAIAGDAQNSNIITGDGNTVQTIHTDGGTAITGNVDTGQGDFVGRDKITYGDEVHGDKIAGDKVEGDKNVYVDSESSRWRFWILLVTLLGILVIGRVIWLNTYKIVETVTAPTPSPTPPIPTPTPTPVIMTGDVNIAIAKPQVMQAGSEVQLAQFQAWSNQELIDLIKVEFGKYGRDEKFEVAVQALPESVATFEEMVNYADKIGADLLLYGLLDVTTNRVTYAPQFYIHPRFAVGASELSGNDAFGNPIAVDITAAGADKVAWKDKLSPRLADWAAFIVGLGLFDAKAYDKAITILEGLTNSDGWENETGKVVLYLWLGTTYMAKAQYDQTRGILPSGLLDCIASGSQVVSDAECGLLSYQKALELEPNYRRAQMGIGNYSLEFETAFGCTRFDNAIKIYEEALNGATQPEDLETKYLETALVPLKLNYQIGLAHARALEEGCDPVEQHVTIALEYLQHAVAIYDEHGDTSPPLNSSARDLTSRAYYQMGRIYRLQSQLVQAIEAFTKTMAVAQPSTRLNDPWQSIYWVALNQIGAIYLEQYEAGDDTAFELAREALIDVTQAYEEKQFGENFDTEPFAASAAWFHLGRLYRASAERDADKLNLAQLSEAQNAFIHSIEVLCPIDQSDPKLIDYRNDGLPWISYFELGEVYRLWEKNENALQHYQAVMTAMDADRLVGNNNLALAIYSRSALGMGKIRFAQNRFDDAAQILDLAIDAGGNSREVVQEATSLLEKIVTKSDTAQPERLIVNAINYCGA